MKTYNEEKPLWQELFIVKDKLSRTRDPTRQRTLNEAAVTLENEIKKLRISRLDDS